MPGVMERLCPKCEEPAEPDDEACSECGSELSTPTIPPGKKICVNCSKLIKLKAKFCPKCRAPQNVKRKCCDEDLSDDDTFCSNCGKDWTASGVKAELSQSSPKADQADKSARDHSGPRTSDVVSPEAKRVKKVSSEGPANHELPPPETSGGATQGSSVAETTPCEERMVVIEPLQGHTGHHGHGQPAPGSRERATSGYFAAEEAPCDGYTVNKETSKELANHGQPAPGSHDIWMRSSSVAEKIPGDGSTLKQEPLGEEHAGHGLPSSGSSDSVPRGSSGADKTPSDDQMMVTEPSEESADHEIPSSGTSDSVTRDNFDAEKTSDGSTVKKEVLEEPAHHGLPSSSSSDNDARRSSVSETPRDVSMLKQEPLDESADHGLPSSRSSDGVPRGSLAADKMPNDEKKLKKEPAEESLSPGLPVSQANGPGESESPPGAPNDQAPNMQNAQGDPILPIKRGPTPKNHKDERNEAVQGALDLTTSQANPPQAHAGLFSSHDFKHTEHSARSGPLTPEGHPQIMDINQNLNPNDSGQIKHAFKKDFVPPNEISSKLADLQQNMSQVSLTGGDSPQMTHDDAQLQGNRTEDPDLHSHSNCPSSTEASGARADNSTDVEMTSRNTNREIDRSSIGSEYENVDDGAAPFDQVADNGGDAAQATKQPFDQAEANTEDTDNTVLSNVRKNISESGQGDARSPAKKRKSKESDKSDEVCEPETDRKKKPKGRRNSDPAASEQVSNEPTKEGYNLRSRSRTQSANLSSDQAFPATVSVHDTPLGNSDVSHKDDGANDDIKKQLSAAASEKEKGMEENQEHVVENEKMKKMKEEIPGGYFKLKKNTPDGPEKNKNRKNTDSKLAVDLVAVTFKVVIGPEFKYDPNKHEVGVRFSEDELGGFEGYPKRLHVERMLRGNYYLMAITVSISKNLLKHRGTRYKYLFKARSASKWEWEELLQGKHNGIEDRFVRLAKDHMEDTWSRFDIIMFPQADKFLQKKRDKWFNLHSSCWHQGSYEQLKIGRLIGTLAMFPEWSIQLPKSFEDFKGLLKGFLTQFHQVFDSMKRLILNEKFLGTDYSLIQEYITIFVRDGMKLLSDTKPEAGFNLRFFIAIAGLHIFANFGFDISEDEIKMICNALILPSTGDDVTELSNEIRQYLESLDRKMFQTIVNFVIFVMRQRMYDWLYVMPLVHLLSDHCAPFEKKSMNAKHNERYGSWWGIKEISSDLEKFKREVHPADIPLGELMTKLQPLFKLDYLLPRTIVATLRMDQMKRLEQYDTFDPDVCLALIFFSLKRADYYDSNLKEGIFSVFNFVHCQLIKLKSEWDTASEYEKEVIVNEAHLYCRICCDIMELIKSNYFQLNRGCHKIDVVKAIAETSSSCIALLWEFLDDRRACFGLKVGNYDLEKDMDIFLRTFKNCLYDWVQMVIPYHMMEGYPDKELKDKSELKAWSDLLGITWPDKNFQHGYTSGLQKSLEARISSLKPEEVIALYANEDYSNLNSIVEEVVSAVAFKAVQTGCETGTFFGGYWSQRDFGRLSLMLEKVFVNAWPKDTDDAFKKFKHVLQWPSMTNYIKLFYDQKRVLLNENSLGKMQDCVSLLEDMTGMIVSGKIQVEYLRRVFENEKNFLEICGLVLRFKPQFAKMDTLVDANKLPAAEILKKIIKLRREEHDSFIKVRSQVNILLTVCKDIDPVDTSHLEKKESLAGDRLFLHQMCNPRCFGPGCENEPVVVVYFELPQVVFDVLKEVPKYQNFQLCSYYMKAAAKGFRDSANDRQRVLSMEEVVRHVWNPCMSYCLKICHNIKDGAITLRGVDQLLKNVSSKRLQEEIHGFCTLNIIGGDLSWIDSRFKQFVQYEKMKSVKTAAEVVMNTAHVFDLSGDFSFVEKLLESVQNPDQPLRNIEDRMVIAGKRLEHVDQEKLKCVRSFIKAREMVEWLRENLKGTQEVKVLVDLAMIRAAGQGDVEVNRVSCLHLAVTGFAPLIYDLKESAGFSELMDCLEEVWRVLQNDKSLPDRLDEVSSHLQWLQDVHKAHGDVEMNALELAGSINDRGVFIIGRSERNQNGKLGLEDVVSLILPQDETREKQELSLKELHDLQSKLMLVAGKAEKGKDEVDRFSQMFDGVIKLGNTFVKLCEAGCILFKHWNAKFFCNKDKKYCVHMDFELMTRKLIGLPDEGMDVLKHLDEMCSFMEDCLNGWIDYIRKQRDHYAELNYFTMTQLVRLRSKMALLKDKKPLDADVFHLLHIVKEGCSEDHLRKAMSSAWEELQSNEQLTQSETTEEEDDIVDREAKFIKELMDEHFSKRLAMKALKKFGVDNVDEALMWLDTDMDEDEEEEEKSGMEMQSDKDWAWVQQNLLQDAGDSKSHSSLKPLLEKVWKGFLSSSTQSVSDYLSVEHLGLMLKHLRMLDDHHMNRTAPKHLVKGKPNLVVCPARDILNVVLSIYNQDQSKPLPRRDEVLYCTESTTLEEVDLLWRRALSDKSGRIFCIMFVDQLTYDVSEMAVKSLEKLMKDSSDYHLVILCASEGETKSQLVTAFENCRIGVPNVMSDQVSVYLKNKFSVGGAEMISCVDEERSSVRLVRSERPGMGKSLFVKRLAEKLSSTRRGPVSVTLPLHQRKIDIKNVMEMLMQHMAKPGSLQPMIYHFDIAYEVLEGVDYLLFNLLVLGSVSDLDGNVWQRSPLDLYVVETLPRRTLTSQADQGPLLQHVVLRYLPSLLCRSPVESMEISQEFSSNPDYKPRHDNWSPLDQLMDDKTFRSEPYQRVFQYLQCLNLGSPMGGVNPRTPQGSHHECLEVLLGRFGVEDPSWSELNHFVSFLDRQLRDFERSVFCQDFFAQDLPGFKAFVLQFMLQMSNDFATRSLVVTEETPGASVQTKENLEQYQIRRKWEESPHPFLFFNDDTMTMTFLGFNINRANGDVIDPQTGKIIKNKIMTAQLYDALLRNRVNLSEKFDSQPRNLKIDKLCKVIGIPDSEVYDPDITYQLTTDNVKKMLAIQMRFRCGIPVVIMGETGCGKTRLIQFMCDLQVPPGSEIKNLIKVKTHGGTTEEDIRKKVEEACREARANMRQIQDLRGPEANIQTVLFFDEANTTEAIGLIKEIMVDKRMNGQPFDLSNGLKIVAACNPYRRHSPEMVKKLEHAGLGYYVRADETKEKLGEIPMRQLVYRVQALPQSLLPLVWDFGQLNTNTEELYIKQIVIRFLREAGGFEQNVELCDVISSILAASQEYIRENKDECIFVSLRDIERVMKVMMWFYKLRTRLFVKMDDLLKQEKDQLQFAGHNAPDSDDENQDEDEEEEDDGIDPIVRSLILALGVCYIASLENRKKYCKFIVRYFKGPCALEDGVQTIEEQIDTCQNVFVEEVQVADNIARNLALKENLFMMVVCVELRIPLFLVGKPGSSKSLAKTVVEHALEGRAAKSEVFRDFKQAHMISCQCSRLSTADVIVGTFQQCAKLQENKKEQLEEYVSVVILDEVGLAEDSPHMPLKTLHPLLEDGCIGDEKQEAFKKVGFIGISNWALDPAKTNRGILLQRGVPTKDELHKTAVSISSSDVRIKNILNRLIKPLTEAYCDVIKLKHGSEFFGLRDFYSLIKMLVQLCGKSRHNELSWRKVLHAVWRNFDGLEDLGDRDQSNPIRIFEQRLADHMDKSLAHDDDPQSSSMVSDGLTSDGRYLLILTEKDTPLDLLHQQLPHVEDAIVIYGSSFPRDQEYTQVCRNINSIKMCMEAGRTVILHNLENLYESLYDALNQYYIIMGPNRFVDLGLGTQRVKCIVHKDFRLVVVAEKETVYKKFSIPLINRLEKHFMHVSSTLTRHQNEIVESLQLWAEELARASKKSSPADLLVGYHVDAAATVVLQTTKDLGARVIDAITPDLKNTIEDNCKEVLLQSADPEALMRLPVEQDRYKQMLAVYFTEQSHESLADYLHKHIISDSPDEARFCQITTYGKLLSSFEKDKVAEKLGWSNDSVFLQSLQAFNTEQQFSKMLRKLFLLKKDYERVLILQCDSGNEHTQLLACARHYIMNTYKQCQEELQGEIEEIGHTHVVLVVQLPRQKGGCFISFQGGKWLSAHVDDLRPSPHPILVQQLKKKSIRELVEDAVKQDHKCRQYLTQMGGKKTEQQVSKAKPSFAGSRNLGQLMETDDFSDMPALEEPDEDINVYRPERERVASMEDDDVVMTEGAQGGPRSEMIGAGDDVEMEVDRSNDDSQMEIEDAKSDGETQMELDDHVADEGGELCLQQLLFSCCSKAATMLRDIDHQHTLERIQTIKEQHFPQPGSVKEYSDFAAIVQMRLLGLLSEKETRAGSIDQARKWLNGALQHISEIGTFRRTWMAYIEKQLAPLLAGLLKYADTNNNMALLEEAHPDHWLHRLWLKMFSNPAVTTLEFKDLLPVGSANLPDEFMVRMTGYNGQEMRGSLPFSWVIKDVLDNLLEQTKQLREDQEGNLDDMFHKTELGQCLREIYEEVGMQRVVERYLNDYVRMVYRVVTDDKEQEYSLIIDMIRASCKNEPSSDEKEHQMSLADVHKAFSKIQNRVQNLSQLLSVFPTGIEKLKSFMDDPDNRDDKLMTTSEMTQDMICVKMCMDNLKPDSKEIGSVPEMRQAWLLKVELLMPVLGRIIEQLHQSHVEFGQDCRSYHHKFRCDKDAVKAVYLFYKHVQSSQMVDDPMMNAKIRVWKHFKDGSDFRKKETMEEVRKLMKLCNEYASKMYLKIKEQCGICTDAMKEPVQLPCKHIFCKPCLEDMKNVNENGELGKCPSCNKDIPQDFDIVVIQDKKEASEAHNRYKQRCNTFFIELVAQLVFVGHEPVDEAVVEMLLGCVTRESKLREAESKFQHNRLRRTKKLTVLDDCIDPTPVVRSLLLQLLLRARVERLEEYMDRYFKEARKFLGNDQEQLSQLCLLFVHSYQDTFYHRMSKVVPGSVNEIEMVRNLIYEAEGELDDPRLSMASIEAIGKLRFCLDKLSGYLHQAFIVKKDASQDKMRNMLASAKSLCTEENAACACWYLLRQLVRLSGLEYVVNMIQNHNDLIWIFPPEVTAQDFNQPHALSIYGDNFENLKIGIRQACRSNDEKTLPSTYKNLPKKNRKIYLMVALYVDVTLAIAGGTLADQNVQTSSLVKCLGKCETDPNDPFVQGLLSNQLGQQLTIHSNQDVTEQSLAAVITHFMIVLTNAPENNLTKPFKDIMHAPRTMQDVLLPTMPQDDLVEIYETMAKELKGGWDNHGNFGVYRCPNQHIFMVNNCGHLTEDKSKCPTCKAPIGGQSYNKALPGVTNVKKDDIRDTTETGHCLGPAHSRTKNPFPERKLNRLTMTVTRFFVHLALFAGANSYPQEVANLIKPKLAGSSVNTFLWNHLVFDVEVLAKCINRSMDDVFLLMHMLLQSISATDGTRAKFSLKDKLSREAWEEAFANTYLNPVLNNFNAELQDASVILSGENQILKKLYEQDEDEVEMKEEDEEEEEEEEFYDDEEVGGTVSFNNIFNLNALWRHKTRICLEDVVSKLDEYRSQRKDQKDQEAQGAKATKGKKGKKKNEAAVNFGSDPEDCDVLHNFLEKHDRLSAIRFLPNITRLVRRLARENHRVLYYHEANTLTLDRFLSNVGDRIQREMYSSFIDDFAAAWEIVRPFLPSYVFGGLSVPKEYTNEPIRKDRTVIATLLPATEGRGLCAIGLINYLVQLQNDFLMTLPGINTKEGGISMEELFPSNLIFFHPDKDLLPMFLAHCDYSLEVGKTLQIAYNFPALQRHVEERLLRGIPLIDIKVEQVVFREDLTNAAKLTNLNDIIPQEYLSMSVVRQIQGELRHLSDITECLLNLDIALGFLMSFRSQSPTVILTKFLSDTLGLNTSFFPPKVHQACELRHVKALWLLLRHESAKVLSRTAQDPFERVSRDYTEDLMKDDEAHLDSILPHLNTDLFLAELHECIVMQITKPAEMTGDEQVANWKHRLDDVLCGYIMLKDEPPEITVIFDRRLGDSILASKCVSVWKYVFQKSMKM